MVFKIESLKIKRWYIIQTPESFPKFDWSRWIIKKETMKINQDTREEYFFMNNGTNPHTHWKQTTEK